MGRVGFPHASVRCLGNFSVKQPVVLAPLPLRESFKKKKGKRFVERFEEDRD